MDVILLNNELLTLINIISINIGIVEFMDYFPLLKQGRANIKTIHYIIKSYVILGGNISINLNSDIMNDNIVFDDYLKILNNKKIYFLTEYEEECVLAYELFDIICTCKSRDHIPKTGSGWLRIKYIARIMHQKSPELSVFILYMCISANSYLINKILNNYYVKLANAIYCNYARKMNNDFFIKESQINIGNLDPRYGNHTLYKFAKLLNESDTCAMIEKITIKKCWMEKQVLINNFEDLIGPSNIPDNIFNYLLQFI